MERVLDRLKEDEKNYRKPVEPSKNKEIFSHEYKMARFKNDLMQLVVNCQMKEIRPRVRSSLVSPISRYGNYSLGHLE